MSPTVDLPRVAQATSTKRQLYEVDQSPAKMAPLMNVQQPQDGTPVLQHPKPNNSYAFFLEKFIDPFHRGPHADSEFSYILKWLESVGSDRNKRCRSDSHLQPRYHSSVPRGLTRSAPVMDYTQDAGGFAVPVTPASAGSWSRADTENRSIACSSSGSGRSSGKKSLIEDELYREVNLATNHIFLRSPWSYPAQIANLVDHMGRGRDSPGPSQDEVKQDVDFQSLEDGAGEAEVARYFHSRMDIFPNPGPSNDLRRAERLPMARHVVPDVGSKIKVRNPIPNLLYGYDREAFSDCQKTQLTSMGNEMVVNTQRLIYPFFMVEFRGDGPGGSGSMWAATNQCLGGSASCVNITERLNHRLRLCQNSTIDSAVFSVAMNGIAATLYVSWKHNELEYQMSRVGSFALQDPSQFIQFRKYIRNIIDWGKDTRLKEIRDSLDSLLEESRKRTSATAKSRTPPSADSTCRSNSSRSGRKKRKTSSTR